MFKAVSEGHTFIQNEGDVIKVYNTVGDITDLEPVFISRYSAKSQKDFEIEISYILQDYLNDRDCSFYD